MVLGHHKIKMVLGRYHKMVLGQHKMVLGYLLPTFEDLVPTSLDSGAI